MDIHSDFQRDKYKFTNDWFNQTGKRNFEWLLPQLKPKKILEIGSFEGASTCFMIDLLGKNGPLEIHCIDTWLGGQEHQAENMNAVEHRFLSNTAIAIRDVTHNVSMVVHKGYSDKALATLLNSDLDDFDFIYVDGSHEAPDVIFDAILSFRLLKVGGILGFDDYSWGMNNILMSPKIAIDSFININSNRLRIVTCSPYQIYIQKITK